MVSFQELKSSLKAFDSVCKGLHVTYFLMFRSLLGSVRYHVIIPWDDDMDVMVPSNKNHILKRIGKTKPTIYS